MWRVGMRARPVVALPVLAAAAAGCQYADRRAEHGVGGCAPLATSSKTQSADCVSSTVLLVLRGVGAGVAWTVGVDAYALLGAPDSQWAERLAGRNTTKARELSATLLRLGARNVLGFAAFLGIFGGVSCSLERIRGRNDLLNPFAGGFAAGLAILPGDLRSPRMMLTTALLCGAASMGFHFFIPAGGDDRNERRSRR